MNIDRMTFEIYWSYYLSVEKMLINTVQFVSPSEENKNTYSDEFTKIILLSCSEIDSILKLLCKLNNIILNDKEYNMKNYAKMLEKDKSIKRESYGPEYVSTINESFLVVTPFKDMDYKMKYAGLEWWKDYQFLKHNRMENAKRGNLINAIISVSAYYILMIKLMDYLDEFAGHDYVIEHNRSKFLIPCV